MNRREFLGITAGGLAWATLRPLHGSTPEKTAQTRNGVHCITVNLDGGRPDWRTVMSGILDLEYISGLMVYVNWRSFEPARGDYRWELFDVPLEIARRKGKTASLALLVQAYAPEWVMERSETFEFRHIHPLVGWKTSPVPWDEQYKAALYSTVSRLGARYDGHSALHYVAVNGPSSLFGVETNFPVAEISPEEEHKLAFSLDKFEAGWKESIDRFAEAFPNTDLALGLHYQMFGDVNQAESLRTCKAIRDYTIERQASRSRKLILRLLGLGEENPKYFAGPYTADNKTINDYLSLVWDVRDKVQLAYEAARIFRNPNAGDRQPLDSEGFRRVLWNGISHSANWIEIKYPDVWNVNTATPYEPYAAALAEAHRELRKDVSEGTKESTGGRD